MVSNAASKAVELVPSSCRATLPSSAAACHVGKAVYMFSGRSVIPSQDASSLRSVEGAYLHISGNHEATTNEE